MKKTVKHVLRLGILALALVLVLAACGGNGDNGGNGGNGGGGAGGGGNLSGSYVQEDGSPGVLTFTDNSFVLSMPYTEMDLGDLTGDFSIRGTFSIDESAQTINLNVDIQALIDETTELTEALFAQDPSLVAMMEDPDLVDFIEPMLESVFDMIHDSVMDEFDDVEVSFEDGFNRLIMDDGSVFVRQ